MSEAISHEREAREHAESSTQQALEAVRVMEENLAQVQTESEAKLEQQAQDFEQLSQLQPSQEEVFWKCIP